MIVRQIASGFALKNARAYQRSAAGDVFVIDANTIYYVDLEGGNDSNDGLNFTRRKKTINSISPVAGDTVRVMGALDPINTGINASWETGPDALGGRNTPVNIVSSTNATPISVQATAHGLANGDTVIIYGHGTNTSANGTWEVTVTDANNFTLQNADGSNSVGNGVGDATGTVTKVNHLRVKLASAVTKNIACCGNRNTKTNWTASANVTSVVTISNFKEGGESNQIAIASAFTTGKAAYLTLPTPLDLSAYKQVSFRLYNTGAAFSDGALQLKLCSDTTGDTPVNTVDIPTPGGTFQWMTVTVDTGGALGASIASIALYVVTDNGGQNIYLDNILACKDSASNDAITLSSLLGKNVAGEHFWSVDSINGTRVMLGTYSIGPFTALPTGYQGGVTETVPLYRQESIRYSIPSSGGFTVTATSGTEGNYVTYSGGWNRVDMSTQALRSWLDGKGYALTFINLQSKSWVKVENFGFTRYQRPFQDNTVSQGICVDNVLGSGNNSFGIFSGNRAKISRVSSVGGDNNAAISLNGNNFDVQIDDLMSIAEAAPLSIGGSNGVVSLGRAIACNSAVQFSNAGNVVLTLGQSKRNNGAGISFANGTHGNTVRGGVLQYNGASISVAGTSGENYLKNCTLGDTTKTAFSAGAAYRVFSESEAGVAGAHYTYMEGGQISAATDQRHTASGLSWKFNPTGVVRTVNYPMRLPIGKILCQANVTKSITIWTRRDSTDIHGVLAIRGGQIAGVANDVTIACNPTINTWVQSSALSITPTEDGVVEIEFQVYDGVGTTNSYWIDDLTVA